MVIAHQIESRVAIEFKVGIKATLILNLRLCGSLRSPRAVVYSAMHLQFTSRLDRGGFTESKSSTTTNNYKLQGLTQVVHYRARNWHCPIVRDDQHSGKDEFSFTELVLPPTGRVPLLDNY